MRDARAALIHVLRSACSGELAAGYAYRGHWKSLRSDSPVHVRVRERIRVIESEEWHHRDLVLGLLRDLGSGPSRKREMLFWTIGKVIGAFCHVGGWFIPMYGAGRLERWNIVEYENAARYAGEAGFPEMIDCLLAMAEVEWEHERFFREQCEGHWMLRLFPLWSAPPAKESIRLTREVA
jgi:hypothetical protein